jgi:transketolase
MPHSRCRRRIARWREAGARQPCRTRLAGFPLAALPAAERAEFERVMRGELPAGLAHVLPTYQHEAPTRAEPPPSGIFLSAEINDALRRCCPSAWWPVPTWRRPPSHKRGCAAFTATDRGGAYLHCGVREHLMGAMANGMAAHGGVLPLAVTYLAFADYERPAMRMAALMGLPVKFVFSHDSIGIGKNGPTHQPVEMLASLRAMPNMLVMRPADAVEAAECWEIALEHRSGPGQRWCSRARRCRWCGLSAPSRQPAPARGAYVLAEAEGGPRSVTLLATGSEVALALEARAQLQAAGSPTAVVSMPCWELFDDAAGSTTARRARARHRARGLRSRDALWAGTRISARAAASSA